ncbi:hypothetical protein GL263_03810 [Streptomyces durbertensis]|uniref:Secreted protein n=1 Tax=Streptomyces durbertensis TaxID=2448886 RepID=A0ABR6EC90_9ACTN|nr:hypothetical protein [Streptomyces durbertensis]MBB1242702.1 hypothetical protein [Streptomyces durbertensis]
MACVVALAVVASAAVLGVLSADEHPPGQPGDGAAPARVTNAAQDVLRRIQQAGLPVERATVHTPDSDPDHLLGEPDGYHSKVSFEDGRVDGGLVSDNDPGSVALGGVIEVFSTHADAEARARQLQRTAADIPTRAERGYLVRGVLLRLSPYLDERAAEQYRQVLGARPAPTDPPPGDVRDA